jgi:predicted ABC-type ATPase
VYESTLAGLSLRKILERFKSDGYEISLVYVYLDSSEICIERIKSRVAMGGHFVPDDEVRRRYERSKQNFLETYKTLADNWLLFRNPLEGFELVAMGDGVTIRIWSKEQAEKILGIPSER